ncbi:MAG: hypothetical protein CL679_13690 [Bermanella sp.]|nr:hypothetical protein [Bermanella sp.]|tara:strand:- start:265 stop:1086 length:822 start_codon:yes stop_codon:yes gene_type:complete
MKALLLILTFFVQPASLALSLPDEYREEIKDCKALLDEIARSKCGKTALGLLKNAYIKIGVNLSRRSMKFENDRYQDSEFEMEGEFMPSPLLSFSLGDSYFEDSNFGYQLGGTYFTDTAFKQKISRGSNSQTVDLLTYSKMTVYAFSPTLFYSFGREENTPLNAFTAGIGLNISHTDLKGSAYVTDDKSNANCYVAGSNVIAGTASKDLITQTCDFKTYDSSGLSHGARIYLAFEYEKWITEVSSSVHTQDIQRGYQFSTYDLSFSVSRKLGF